MTDKPFTLSRHWLITGLVLLLLIGSYFQAETEQAALNAVSVESLYEHRQSDVQLEVSGEVVRLLQDDTKGSQHQRFIIELPSGLSLLVAHNIDLAPRINRLQKGDEVDIFGEYVWNDQGGLMHWTHHDPNNKHPDGWIRHRDKLYQ